ncbi:UvrD/REP helicase [Chloroherpeton thalassium ATCC 35110]|uniref:DNA 3'-5' helicase n=1 Tax=Chloroherpeton thalassium (strain ATCC 35110 / GB-78) TaxID=517418 RepID=B3QYG2_CHLT3|nr:ATP-dependent helicase [Chloroherpeton thalassium]ACF13590.1 UvrD/REP helicase [Chloroherpeton thalassium ATCC 35110]
MNTRKFVLYDDSDDGGKDSPAHGASLEKYQSELNSAQFEAVTTTDGALLVVAGAGTGKTKTLTYRVGYLIESGVPASDILLLTFTRRAAQEMLARAAAICDSRCSQIQGGTFHAFAHKLLRLHASQIGLAENFTVLDQADAEETLDIVRTALGFNKKEKRFPKKRTLATVISTSRNKQLPIELVVEAQYPHFLSFAEEIEFLAKKYREYKRANALLDFDDLLTELRDLFLNFPELGHQISSSLRYVMVDEYQDTNLVQAELVAHFSAVHKNVMAVGDDAQSIYAFRGANYRNILDFPNQFPECKLIKLEENYRSTPEILSLTNFVINRAKEKFTKTLFSRKPEGELPAIVSAPDERFQTRFIAQRILELREEGVPLREIAVLMRNGRDSYALELELRKRNIPFVKFGGQKVVEAAHIKDFLAYLKLIYNPRDVISWNRVLQLLEGVGPKTAKQVIEWVKDSGSPYEIGGVKMSAKYAASLKNLGDLLGSLSSGKKSLGETAAAVMNYYLPLMHEKYYEDFPKREKDLENFLNIIANYQNLETLLAELALDPIELTAIETEPAKPDEQPMTLSTIHSAKGLEWRTVFLINMLDGVLPSKYAVDDAASLDEELRLLYVAMTRAKSLLYVCYPIVCTQRGFEDYMSNPSRFLQKLPDALYERILLVQEKRKSPPQLSGKAKPQLQKKASGGKNENFNDDNLPF